MNDNRIIIYLRILNGIAIAFLISFIIIGILALQKVERMTAVAESVNGKLDTIMTAGAPLGHAAVEKGVETLKGVDAGDLSKGATQGIKDVGAAAKAKAMELLGKDK